MNWNVGITNSVGDDLGSGSSVNPAESKPRMLPHRSSTRKLEVDLVLQSKYVEQESQDQALGINETKDKIKVHT
jgi:hypothetical protein